ncbi:serine/threonine-protein kinase meng-po-like [Agrilus planipennis]|uniref:Serine/threonine-protein kinase meng-po-like n=1 Tax=Agrilus planipennis TaxID=224129 RepID=A0A1W4WSD8_AGRPL|nr:serine/threonine-protein kinase meng-po-like [Agrilus planipennis]
MMRSSIGGSIHRIREFELEKVNLADEFDILQIVGEGWFGKILLVEHKATDTEMVLKALPKPYTALRDFYREFHYGLHLGTHKNIISTYDVAFETAGFYVFSQEYAPLGDLTSNVSDTGIGELHSKRVAKQLAAALEHLHMRDLVHRDVKLDNILVFKSDFSRIKLCDFGETRRNGSNVLRRNEWLPYAPPEVLEVKTDDSYKAETTHDVWQYGIVIFVCLTGCLPWQKAALDDPRYVRYHSWQSSAMPLKKQPKLFKLVSSKALKLFKKFLEPRKERRPISLGEVHRFLDDRWLAKGIMEKNNNLAVDDDGLCPSMYSFHSSPEEKNKLLFTLTQYGIETTVDRTAKKDRIRQWIQTSVIEEEDEEETASEENVMIKDNESNPIGERVKERGPISENSVRRRERRISTISSRRLSDIYVPPIDPRIPLEQQKDKWLSMKNLSNLDGNLKKENLVENGIHEKPITNGGYPKLVNGTNDSPVPNRNSAKENHHNKTNNRRDASPLRHEIHVQIPQSSKLFDVYSTYCSDNNNQNTNNNYPRNGYHKSNGVQHRKDSSESQNSSHSSK